MGVDYSYFVIVVQDVGVAHVCDGLYYENLEKELRVIVLWNNQITYQAMAAISRAVVRTASLFIVCVAVGECVCVSCGTTRSPTRPWLR